MKKIILITLLVLFSFAPATFAHSHLESSTPENGEVVTEELREITLTFDGKVEIGSTFELLDPNGQAVSIEEIIVTDTEVIGKIPNDLKNGNYQVLWNIISADGHQMEGEFSFVVNISETETPPADSNDEEPVTENGENSEANSNDETNQGPEQNANTTENDVASDQTENEGSSNLVSVIVVVLVLAIIIIFFVLRRKK
ncbi:copper resistance CopC family protein [Niallia sp. Krafla_26]|uniref:copper resistance CopC family protein n=1 Tax=Niallia sp. Krafla_26 TaxID=3064703 RepID=UPI003D16DCEA